MSRARGPRSARVVSIDSGDHREKFLTYRDELVREHLPLVETVARRLHSQLPACFDLDDLIAAGNLALVRLATRYRPREHGGAPFSAFARIRIRGAMLDSIKGHRGEEAAHAPLSETERNSMVDNGASIEIGIDEDRLRERLRSTIAALPSRQRAVIAAFYSENLPRPLRDKQHRFQRLDHLACVGAALGLPEWRVIREHAAAIEELRRRLAG